MKSEFIKCSTHPSMLIDMPVLNKIVYEEYAPNQVWAQGAPLHSLFKEYEFDRTDVAFIYK